MTSHLVYRTLGVVALLLVGACTSISPDGGMGPVEATARQHLDKSVIWARDAAQRDEIDARVAQLLARPLAVDDAVQIALLNNRGLQAGFFELGIAQAEVLRAGTLPNPHVSLFRASRAEGGTREFKIEQALVMNLFALATLPRAVAIEQRRFEQTQRAVALEVVRLAADTRRAYYQAVAAEQTLRYRQQVSEAASAGAELARRMVAAGNWSALHRAREHRFSAEAALALAHAQQARSDHRERLTRLLGLWGAAAEFKLPERLPDLPAQPADQPDIERDAMARRIDLQMARIEIEALADSLGLTRTTRFINVLEAGPARVLEGERDAGYKRGYEIQFELPLFDWGSARVARAQAIYEQALERTAQAAIEARSQVRQAWRTYRSGWEIARHHRDELVPISRRIAEENLLRYNGMLIGVFELLADARSQITTVIDAIDASRDFWIAQADLDMALLGRPTGNTP